MAIYAIPLRFHGATTHSYCCHGDHCALNAFLPPIDYLPKSRFCRCKMMQTLWISFWDEDVGGPQCVVKFGFEHGWTVDGWCIVTIIDVCLSCDMRTLPVISTTSECKQNVVSALWALAVNSQCLRSGLVVTTRCMQWKRRESAMGTQAIAN